LGLGRIGRQGDVGVGGAMTVGFGVEDVDAWSTSSFCRSCCFCIFFLSFCDIFWMPLVCSEVLAFIASVKLDGRETEASAMMSLRPLFPDVDLISLQGALCEANSGVNAESCGARDVAGEEEYCGRGNELPRLEASVLRLPETGFPLALDQTFPSPFELPTSNDVARSCTGDSGDIGFERRIGPSLRPAFSSSISNNNSEPTSWANSVGLSAGDMLCFGDVRLVWSLAGKEEVLPQLPTRNLWRLAERSSSSWSLDRNLIESIFLSRAWARAPARSACCSSRSASARPLFANGKNAS
jgi:hypothetical protein